jgi:hypothetical protein
VLFYNGVKTSLMHENEIQRLWVFENQVLGRIHKPNNEVTRACIPTTQQELHNPFSSSNSIGDQTKGWKGQDG